MNNEYLKKIFNLLDEWSNFDKNDLQDIYSDENLSIVNDLASELNDEYDYKTIKSSSDFVEFIIKLRETKKTWSRKLGQVIIDSENIYTQGKKDKAFEILDKFIRECPSAFYRQIAVDQKKQLS